MTTYNLIKDPLTRQAIKELVEEIRRLNREINKLKTEARRGQR